MVTPIAYDRRKGTLGPYAIGPGSAAAPATGSAGYTGANDQDGT